MSPPKLLILSQGIDGGVAVMTSTLASGMAVEGIACSTLYIGRPAVPALVEKDKSKGIRSKAYVTGKALTIGEVIGLLLSVFVVLKETLQFRPDKVIFAGFIPALLYPIFMRPFTRAQFVFWDHSPQNTYLKIKKIFFPLSLHFFDRIASISPSTAKALTAYFNIPPEKITIIYNGINTERWTAVPPPPDFSTLRVIMPSRFDAQKDHLTIVRAVSYLRAQNIPIEATFVGAGATEERIRYNIREYGGETCIRILPHTDDLPSLMARHNIVCLSTNFEGLGLVIVEGMLSGRISLATRTTGCVDVIEDGVTGFLFTGGDAEDLAKKLLAIRTQPDGDIMIERARRFALENFSLQAMVGKFRKLMNI